MRQARTTRGRGGDEREPDRSGDVHDPDGVRLQKVLAGAGLGSRRACEALIESGRVRVDGRAVRELGVRVDPGTAQVEVDGLLLQLDTSKVYLALNKPRGVVSTMRDEQGREDLSAFVADRPERLFHVGRLDTDTEGLILLTNDGDLAHRLQHPSFEVPRTYLAEVAGPVARDVGRRLRAGVELEDGEARADSFRLVDSVPGRAVVEVVLHEGRKHVVRRMLAAVGHPVLRLVRTRIGPVHLGDLRAGATRPLTREELGRLRGAPAARPARRGGER
ncbi:pseudouridine synthase [Quadrisphaera sp. DSM 44207]|uniref:pseudouridine synthase n=1 Tax=Quadrisphaera sp. DSM 44207 TaxID=1881057 RepID=UPI000892097D|nr:pseudouridine synthase [Quadrisphaera sp. DSM 44207]SDQ38998.1 23S rRNA pseudouridine2605 synthase [Quadrisphaera sp. DSM 44207]